jgi:hypothetical protein
VCLVERTMKTTTLTGLSVLAIGAVALACSKNSQPSTASPVVSASTAPSAAPSAAAAVNPPFEGEIVLAVKDEMAMKLPTSITYDVKGNKVRYAAAAAPVYAVGDLDAQQVYAIDDGQKSYEALGVKPAPNAKAPPTQTVQKSGKVETIAGLTCEDWTIADGVEKVDVCASKGIEYFDLASDAKTGSTEAPWAVALTTEKAFPLRVVVRDKAGKEEYRAEATRADRKKLDDALFQLPSAYKKADLAKETKLASLP